MKLFAAAILTISASAFAQQEVITSDFQLLNQVTNYKLYTALSKKIEPVRISSDTYGVTLPGLLECEATLRRRDTLYSCFLLKGGWKTHKETVLSGRGELELTSWEKDGKRLFDALDAEVAEETRDGVGEDFVTHRLLTKKADSCSGYDPNSLTALYSYRLEVSKDGQAMYDAHTALVRVMMDRPVYECP